MNFDFESLGVWTGASLSAAALIAGAWKYLLIPLWSSGSAIYACFASYPAMQNDVKSILKEVTPNHGDSMRDQIGRMERKIGHIQQRQQWLLLESPKGHFETDSGGAWVDCNRTIQNILRRSEDQILGWNWIGCIDFHQRTEVRSEYHAAIRETREMGIVAKTLDGPWIQMHGTPAIQNGEFVGFFGTIELIEVEDTAAGIKVIKRKTQRMSEY
jgi:PAS domain-containing protein